MVEITIILTVAAVFFGLKNFIRDQIDPLKDQLHEQKIENAKAIHQLKMENLRLSNKLEQMKRFVQRFDQAVVDPNF